jgi:ESS family glutamate:Na+ symporter
MVLVLSLLGVLKLNFVTRVDWALWNWVVTPGFEWGAGGAKNLTLPMLVGFFTCVGLNATWRLVKGGSGGLVIFWVVATFLAVFQNVAGVALAKLLGESPLLGVICGSLTLTGGHGTAMGFSQTFVQAGFPAAATVGARVTIDGAVALFLGGLGLLCFAGRKRS